MKKKNDLNPIENIWPISLPRKTFSNQEKLLKAVQSGWKNNSLKCLKLVQNMLKRISCFEEIQNEFLFNTNDALM